MIPEIPKDLCEGEMPFRRRHSGSVGKLDKATTLSRWSLWVQSPPELPFHFVGVDSSTEDERLDLLHPENSGPCQGGFIAISENDLDILDN